MVVLKLCLRTNVMKKSKCTIGIIESYRAMYLRNTNIVSFYPDRDGEKFRDGRPANDHAAPWQTKAAHRYDFLGHIL